MQEVGVRELKNQATEILREVREKQAEYIVTYRGRPVAMLVPFVEGMPLPSNRRPAPSQAELEARWAEWDELAREIDQHCQGDRSLLGTLLEMRRERDESLSHPGAGLEQIQTSEVNRKNTWAEWNDLREEIGKAWHTGRTAVEAVAEQRE